MAYLLGGTVSSSEVPEFGKTMTQFKNDSPLFQNVGESVCWMSHNDYISQLPEALWLPPGAPTAPPRPWKTGRESSMPPSSIPR